MNKIDFIQPFRDYFYLHRYVHDIVYSISYAYLKMTTDNNISIKSNSVYYEVENRIEKVTIKQLKVAYSHLTFQNSP